MTNSKKYQSNSFFSGFLLILYLCLGFIPNLEAVDKIAPQWLALSGLNLISLIYLFNQRQRFSSAISVTLYSWLSIIYISFILWAGLSYFYSINPTEVIVNITRQVNVMLMVFIMGILLYQFPKKSNFVSWCITLILSIEVYAVLSEAQEMIKATGVITSGILKGVTANRNITAFSLAIKLPFVLFLLELIKKRYVKAFLTLLIFLTIVCLSMIQSRASFVALGVIVLGYIALNFSKYWRQRKISNIYRIGFLLLPLFFAIIINQGYLSKLGADAVSRAATISLSTNDGSVNQRLRYYEDVLIHLTSNPIFGVGLGNWKLKSIDYDAKDIKGYVVPYHAHSDFIQLGAELGIIGFLLYLGIFVLAVYYCYRLIRFSSISENEKIFIFLLLIALGVYSVDANLNFPIARPQVLVDWAIIIALIVGYNQSSFRDKEKTKTNNSVNLSFLTLGILLALPSIYVTKQVYESLKGQMFLLQDFNSNQYNLPINRIDNIVPDIPNITVTTIPINSVKARYYVNAKKYDKAMVLLNKGTSANPYLFYSEIIKSQIFEQQGKLDSAKFYARKAFFGLPNNDLHASRYINLINLTRDKKSLDESFELMTQKNNINHWKNYLKIAINLYNANDSLLVQRAKKATELFPNDPEIKQLYVQSSIGINRLNSSIELSKKGLDFFNNGDHINSAKQFELAIEANPLDYANFENAATSNYLNGNLGKAIEQIDVVINDLNPLNGKCEYIKALIFIKMGDPIGACPLLETSRDSGFSQAEATFDQYCR